jgi:hypothetical protein
MHALSLSQPWAWSMVSVAPPFRKDYENRLNNPGLLSQASSYRLKRIAIHAAKSWDERGAEFLRRLDLMVPMRVALPAGKVIGVTTLAAILTEDRAREILPPNQQRFIFGPGFLFDDTVAIAEPVTVRGALGFWPLPTDIEQRVLAQLEEGARG